MNINKDFFPTSLSMTRLMVNKLGDLWKRNVKYILEPSAGKADLIENFISIYDEEFGRWKAKGKDQFIIDVVEKNLF